MASNLLRLRGFEGPYPIGDFPGRGLQPLTFLTEFADFSQKKAKISKITLDYYVEYDDTVENDNYVKFDRSDDILDKHMETKKLKATRGKQSRQQRRYGKTREKLLAAALAVFAEKGLAAASVDEITQRADVGRGSFYYHFKDKEELIMQLVEGIISDLTERMEADCANERTLEARLDGVIGAHISFFSRRWEDFVLYYQSRADLTLDESYENLDRPFLKYLKSIEKLIDSTIPEPISDARLRRLACAIAGFISGYYSFASVASLGQNIDKEFMALRKVFVTSLARFVRDAMPDGQVKW